MLKNSNIRKEIAMKYSLLSVLVVGLLLAGCGGSDDDSSPTHITQPVEIKKIKTEKNLYKPGDIVNLENMTESISMIQVFSLTKKVMDLDVVDNKIIMPILLDMNDQEIYFEIKTASGSKLKTNNIKFELNDVPESMVGVPTLVYLHKSADLTKSAYDEILSLTLDESTPILETYRKNYAFYGDLIQLVEKVQAGEVMKVTDVDGKMEVFDKDALKLFDQYALLQMDIDQAGVNDISQPQPQPKMLSGNTNMKDPIPLVVQPQARNLDMFGLVNIPIADPNKMCKTSIETDRKWCVNQVESANIDARTNMYMAALTGAAIIPDALTIMPTTSAIGSTFSGAVFLSTIAVNANAIVAKYQLQRVNGSDGIDYSENVQNIMQNILSKSLGNIMSIKISKEILNGSGYPEFQKRIVETIINMTNIPKGSAIDAITENIKLIKDLAKIINDSIIKPKDCIAQSLSGGQMSTTKYFDFGKGNEELVFSYDAYNIPDSFILYDQTGKVLFSTGGLVSGGGSVNIKAINGIVKVAINAPDPGTGWDFGLNCKSISIPLH